MPAGRTVYRPGEVETTTGGTDRGGGGAGDLGGFGGLFNTLLSKRMQQQEEDMQARREERRRQEQEFVDRRAAAKRGQGRQREEDAQASADAYRARNDPNQRYRETMALRREAAETEAVTGRAPTREVTGFNIIPGRVLDPNAMTGAQRRAFLPGSAGMAPGGAETMGSEIAAARGARPLPSPIDMGGGRRIEEIGPEEEYASYARQNPYSSGMLGRYATEERARRSARR